MLMFKFKCSIYGIVLSQKFKNIDPTLLFRFITAANKEYIENLKKNNPDIEKIVIYKPIWLNELRSKVHSLLSNQHQQQQNKEDKDKLWMMLISIFYSILISSNLITYHQL